MFKKNKVTSQENKQQTLLDKDKINPNNIKVWKSVFYGLFCTMSILTFIAGYNNSYHNDEMDMNTYGKANLKFYSSFGKDSSYKNPVQEETQIKMPILKNYGAFFDIIACSINDVFGIDAPNEFNTRHFLCQSIGLLTVLVAGLITLLLGGGYLGASVTMVLLFCTPTFFGHMLNNTKDIPFAFGYTLSFYGLMLYLKSLPRLNKSALIFLALGLSIAIGARIGGIIIYLYIAGFIVIYLYYNNQIFSQMAGKRLQHILFLGLSAIAGFLIAVLFWPFALSSPIENIQSALTVASRFPMRVPLLFEGKLMNSLAIPAHFIPKWMLMSIPVAVILLFFFSSIVLLFKRKTNLSYLFALIAIVFPIIYAINGNFALYSAWRHLLFVYPLMVVYASMGLWHLLSKIKSGLQIPLVLGISILSVIHPIYWSVKNHPFEYTYFNELSGGFARNYDNYETDYWQSSVKIGLEWLKENENLDPNKRLILATNAVPFCRYALKYAYKDTGTQVTQVGIKSLHMIDWDYMILNTIFFSKDHINNKFPPFGTIYTVDIDKMPVCAVVKRENKWDYLAMTAFNQRDFYTCDSLAALYLKTNPHSETLLEAAAVSSAELNKMDYCLSVSERGLDINPSSSTFLYYKGLCKALAGEHKQAIALMELSLQSGPAPTKKIFSDLYKLHSHLGNKRSADHYAQFLRK